MSKKMIPPATPTTRHFVVCPACKRWFVVTTEQVCKFCGAALVESHVSPLMGGSNAGGDAKR